MQRTELIQACCGAADGPDAELKRKAFDIAEKWYKDNPIAVGCSADHVERHQRKCHRYVVAALRQQQPATGFGIETVFLIWQVISTLWSLWSAWRTSFDDDVDVDDQIQGDEPDVSASAVATTG